MVSNAMRGNGHNVVPSSYMGVVCSKHKQYWHKAMQDKFVSLNESNVSRLATLPTNTKAIPVRWTIDTKVDSEDIITRFKARLVRKSFIQVKRLTTVRLFLPYQSTV